jgi:Na+/pantothenate symporter
MTWLKANGLVLTLLALYTGLMAYHALEGRRKTRGVADYYVGGRAMGGIALGLSFFATYSSTNSFVGFSGQAYSYGASKKRR